MACSRQGRKSLAATVATHNQNAPLSSEAPTSQSRENKEGDRFETELSSSSEKEKKMNVLSDLNGTRFAADATGAVCRLKLSERVALRLPLHMVRYLSKLATASGQSQSELVRQLLIEAIRVRTQRETQRRGATASCSSTDEVTK
jgi:hypothetical protein